MKTINRRASEKRTRTTSRGSKVAAVRESRVILFGSRNDVEVKESIRKAEIAGRKTEVVARPSFDSGLGPCGKHVCSCKEVCKAAFAEGAYPGDKGATMGMSF